jgi:hypothetical protein
MRNLILLCAALSAIATTASAQPAEPIARYVVVFTSDAWQSNPVESQLVESVQRPPAGSPLAQWTAGAAVKHFTPRDPTFARFAELAPVDRLPVVVVQRNDGGYVYKASAENVPTNAYALGREIDYYAGLDPLAVKNSTMADSAEARGRVEWLTEQDFCPDGTCPNQPQPRQPLRNPSRPIVQVGPDSVDLNPTVDFSGLSTPLIIGVVIFALFALAFGAVVLLLILLALYRLLA